MKRPHCPKCRGLLLPDIDLSGKTVSVGCAICGERFFRGIQRRAPGTSDTGLGGPGVAKSRRVAGGAPC